MNIYTEQISAFDTFHEYLNLSPEKSLFFDIETTGLSSAGSSVFLIGTLHPDQNRNWILTQYLADSCDEEAALLQFFLKEAESYDTLIHFNGTTFDIPFVTARAQKYHISHSLEQMRSLDLYQKLRPLKKIYKLEKLNQTSLEKFIGWERKDRLTGQHMIKLYQAYALSGDPNIRNLLLLHNHDDMIGMTRLTELLSVLMLMDDTPDHGISASAGTSLFLNLPLPKTIPVPFSLSCEIGAGIPLTLCAEHAACTITVPFLSGELKYFFSDYKNYYYLPLEDQAIHKSVGSFVDKELRQNARPSTCYIRKSGIFLPQPELLFEPAFRTCYEDPMLCFEYQDTFLTDKTRLISYAASLLRYLFH